MADISNILAALAAQRQNGTPSQQPQQPPQLVPVSNYAPPGYPAPSGAPAPYGLPQPISSGSVDLAGIKPISSGSMSLDPMSQGRDYPTDRVPSRGNDPRVSGRSYRRSRSPSRSPPRMRDDYRDSYNPYRDERRTGADRGYTRDRSLSPGRGARYSPGYRNTRSPPRDRGGADGESEVIPIEKGLVGLIIGKGGENLRRVENQTGARVQFMDGPETAGTQRHCKVSGSRSARAAAIAEIFKAMEDSDGVKRSQDRSRTQAKPNLPPPTSGKEGDSLQIMVPDRTVGLVIGRGGETIRDLQEKSGCHINIVGENKSVNGFRPVNLIGSMSAQQYARELIMEIVESDQKGISVKELRTRGRDDPYDKINDSIMVPGDSVGMIIGKGGETIKEMQNQTGCKINVSPASGRDIQREIGLIGSRRAIDAAKHAIMSKVDAVVSATGTFSSAHLLTLVQEARSRAQGRESHDTYQSSYASQQQQQPAYPNPGMPPAQQGMPAQAGGADPYAQYGGYDNYLRMWYAAMSAQQGGQPPQGEQR
jgi:far upstream element-binding protein